MGLESEAHCKPSPEGRSTQYFKYPVLRASGTKNRTLNGFGTRGFKYWVLGHFGFLSHFLVPGGKVEIRRPKMSLDCGDGHSSRLFQLSVCIQSICQDVFPRGANTKISGIYPKQKTGFA